MMISSARSIAKLAAAAVADAWRRLSRRGVMSAEKGVDWRTARGMRSLGSFHVERAYFGFGREHGGFHGYGVRMRGDIIGQDQIKDG